MNEPKFYRRFDYDRKLLPNQFLSRLEQDVHDLEQAKTKTGYSVGYPGWNLLYYCLYSSLRKDAFNLIIETGSNWGCSTIILGQGLIDRACHFRISRWGSSSGNRLQGVQSAVSSHGS